MQDTDRKLTAAEMRRKELFEATEADLAAQGYREHRLTMGVVAANVFALALAIPLDILLGVGFFALHPGLSIEFGFGGAIGVILVFFALIVVHELIHGLVWSMFAKRRWKSVSFGFILQYLTPYCTCNEPLPRFAYVIGALAPTIVLGLIPVAVAYATGSPVLFVIGALMIIGGGGDMAIVIKMLRFKPEGAEALYLDHPYELGLVVFER